MNEDATVESVEETFKKSPAMTYKLLLLVNSVSTGLREKIRTVRHAITIIGLNPLKKWVQLAIFAADDSRALENPVIDMAAVRAALMEGLAGLHPELNRTSGAVDQAFMVGILSLLKDYYDIPMNDMVSGLNLSEEIRLALVEKSGELGILLQLSELLEQLRVEDAEKLAESTGLPMYAVIECQNRAFRWRNDFA